MSCLAIIPARGGSKRIARKNIKSFCGKPIISYPITVSIKANIFDKVIVSTDDDEIAKISLDYGAEVPFKRGSHISDDHTGTVEVIKNAIEVLEKKGFEYTHTCCIYPCTPFLRVKDLVESFYKLKSSSASYAFPVMKYPHPIQRAFSLDKSYKPVFYDASSELKRTQDLKTFYHDAGQFYWGITSAWKDKKSIHSSGIGLPQSESRFIDIDTIEDWRKAESYSKLFTID